MRKPQLLMGPLALALLGMAFCLWSAFGNDINFCVTAGCSLYQDFSIGGVSLWWLGMTAFAGLFLLALVGASAWGVVFSALALTGDIALLLLMVFTAPCISCLVVAVFFALSFCAFRRAYADEERRGPQRHSLLLLIWMALFLVNVGVDLYREAAAQTAPAAAGLTGTEQADEASVREAEAQGAKS